MHLNTPWGVYWGYIYILLYIIVMIIIIMCIYIIIYILYYMYYIIIIINIVMMMMMMMMMMMIMIMIISIMYVYIYIYMYTHGTQLWALFSRFWAIKLRLHHPKEGVVWICQVRVPGCFFHGEIRGFPKMAISESLVYWCQYFMENSKETYGFVWKCWVYSQWNSHFS